MYFSRINVSFLRKVKKCEVKNVLLPSQLLQTGSPYQFEYQVLNSLAFPYYLG